MPYTLPELPYGYADLEPWISAQTLRLHHDVLHRRYVERLNDLTLDVGTPLDRIVAHAPNGPLLDSALQVFNHDFLWKSMSPRGGSLHPWGINWGPLRGQFIEAAQQIFGSGYVWVCATPDGTDAVVWPAEKAGNPLRGLSGHPPLLTMDVWEHAYLLDHGADRKAYAAAFWDHLANWDFARDNYAAAFGRV